MTKDRLLELAHIGARSEVTRLVDEFGVDILTGVRPPRRPDPAARKPLAMAGVEIAGEPAPRPGKRRHWSKLPGNEKKAAAWRRAIRRAHRA
jgi:hypothetical protein